MGKTHNENSCTCEEFRGRFFFQVLATLLAEYFMQFSEGWGGTFLINNLSRFLFLPFHSCSRWHTKLQNLHKRGDIWGGLKREAWRMEKNQTQHPWKAQRIYIRIQIYMKKMLRVFGEKCELKCSFEWNLSSGEESLMLHLHPK